MNSTSILKGISLIIISVILINCSSSSRRSKARASLADEETIHYVEELLETLPSPSLVPFTLKSIGAEFDKKLINSLNGVESYKNNSDKMALNMGIYASDISYLAAYDHEEDCINYLETSYKMAEALSDSAIYDQSHLDEFRSHIMDENEEAIYRLLGKLFVETSVQMEKNHHLMIAGLALTGSFVEGLYQAVIALESYDDSEESKKLLEPLVKIVLNEEEALRDIIQILDDLPQDGTTVDMRFELGVLDKLYKGDLKEIEDKMVSNPDFIVSKDDMKDITSEVKRIRASIVN
ncbi:MAG: hypothetical protein GDA42_08595 [Ekhidna sp.]|nr:hypothetical protein [Ekhidna sp.]MBC6410499.1 hypothetical protein [Ekhidna sp.]